jgi:hypothetical protein
MKFNGTHARLTGAVPKPCGVSVETNAKEILSQHKPRGVKCKN